MPINIYNDDTSERVDWLCGEDWELPSQIEELSVWLKKNFDQLNLRIMLQILDSLFVVTLAVVARY